LKKIIGQQLQKAIGQDSVNGEKEDVIFRQIMETAGVLEPGTGKIVSINQPKNRFSFLRIAVAASLIFFMSLSGYLLFKKEPSNNVIVQKTGKIKNAQNDVDPVKTKPY
jgi:hypothetical protein